jgi:UDP-N-acetylglucosamine 2-epimerase (non-hydrolysing)
MMTLPAPLTILTLIGTRPEAIKLAPLVQAMRRRPATFTTRVCLTGQHRDLVDDILPAFGITPDENLDIMAPGQTLADSTAKILSRLQATFDKHRPDVVIVQGDTTTAFSGALAAFYAGIPSAHIEAGLRTNDSYSPFPEEMNRRLISRLANFHFAPTRGAAENLLREGVPESQVWVTGNTAIDAVHLVNAPAALPCPIDPTRKLILVTAHRRENMPYGLRGIASAVRTLTRRPDVQILWPVHPNPQVHAAIQGVPASCLTPPLRYPEFVTLMRRAYLILSDSGGIQEEAPSLGKPVLILRDTTERPEAVEAGANVLVGTNPDTILKVATQLLDNSLAYETRAQVRNVYGDGKASDRICATLARAFSTPQLLSSAS